LVKRGVLTIPGWLYDQLKDYFFEHKEELQRNGIKSINKFATKLLEVSLEALTERYQDVRNRTVERIRNRKVTSRPTASEKSL